MLLILFSADISKWWATRNLHAQGYDALEEGEEDEDRGTKFGNLSQVIRDPDAMRLMLRNAREELEEVMLMARLRGEEVDPAFEAELESLRARQARLEERISTLNGFLAATETTKNEETVDLETAARRAAEAENAKKKQGGCADVTKMGVNILKNAIAGFMTIYLYFMDLISDYQVTMLFYRANALRFATVSASLIIGQFAVVWLRVLPYVYVTYGANSTFYRSFLFFGMPFGCFFLDFLMFLEPFGLLPVAPLPETLRQFIPACAPANVCILPSAMHS